MSDDGPSSSSRALREDLQALMNDEDDDDVVNVENQEPADDSLEYPGELNLEEEEDRDIVLQPPRQKGRQVRQHEDSPPPPSLPPPGEDDHPHLIPLAARPRAGTLPPQPRRTLVPPEPPARSVADSLLEWLNSFPFLSHRCSAVGEIGLGLLPLELIAHFLPQHLDEDVDMRVLQRFGSERKTTPANLQQARTFLNQTCSTLYAFFLDLEEILQPPQQGKEEEDEDDEHGVNDSERIRFMFRYLNEMDTQKLLDRDTPTLCRLMGLILFAILENQTSRPQLWQSVESLDAKDRGHVLRVLWEAAAAFCSSTEHVQQLLSDTFGDVDFSLSSGQGKEEEIEQDAVAVVAREPEVGDDDDHDDEIVSSLLESKLRQTEQEVQLLRSYISKQLQVQGPTVLRPYHTITTAPMPPSPPPPVLPPPQDKVSPPPPAAREEPEFPWRSLADGPKDEFYELFDGFRVRVQETKSENARLQREVGLCQQVIDQLDAARLDAVNAMFSLAARLSLLPFKRGFVGGSSLAEGAGAAMNLMLENAVPLEHPLKSPASAETKGSSTFPVALPVEQLLQGAPGNTISELMDENRALRHHLQAAYERIRLFQSMDHFQQAIADLHRQFLANYRQEIKLAPVPDSAKPSIVVPSPGEAKSETSRPEQLRRSSSIDLRPVLFGMSGVDDQVVGTNGKAEALLRQTSSNDSVRSQEPLLSPVTPLVTHVEKDLCANCGKKSEKFQQGGVDFCGECGRKYQDSMPTFLAGSAGKYEDRLLSRSKTFSESDGRSQPQPWSHQHSVSMHDELDAGSKSRRSAAVTPSGASRKLRNSPQSKTPKSLPPSSSPTKAAAIPEEAGSNGAHGAAVTLNPADGWLGQKLDKLLSLAETLGKRSDNTFFRTMLGIPLPGSSDTPRQRVWSKAVRHSLAFRMMELWRVQGEEIANAKQQGQDGSAQLMARYTDTFKKRLKEKEHSFDDLTRLWRTYFAFEEKSLKGTDKLVADVSTPAKIWTADMLTKYIHTKEFEAFEPPTEFQTHSQGGTQAAFAQVVRETAVYMGMLNSCFMPASSDAKLDLDPNLNRLDRNLVAPAVCRLYMNSLLMPLCALMGIKVTVDEQVVVNDFPPMAFDYVLYRPSGCLGAVAICQPQEHLKDASIRLVLHLAALHCWNPTTYLPLVGLVSDGCRCSFLLMHSDRIRQSRIFPLNALADLFLVLSALRNLLNGVFAIQPRWPNGSPLAGKSASAEVAEVPPTRRLDFQTPELASLITGKHLLSSSPIAQAQNAAVFDAHEEELPHSPTDDPVQHDRKGSAGSEVSVNTEDSVTRSPPFNGATEKSSAGSSKRKGKAGSPSGIKPPTVRASGSNSGASSKRGSRRRHR